MKLQTLLSFALLLKSHLVLNVTVIQVLFDKKDYRGRCDEEHACKTSLCTVKLSRKHSRACWSIFFPFRFLFTSPHFSKIIPGVPNVLSPTCFGRWCCVCMGGGRNPSNISTQNTNFFKNKNRQITKHSLPRNPQIYKQQWQSQIFNISIQKLNTGVDGAL